ncbi:MAG TPA: restriction endonuclease subunit S [Pyrinomonadaceae bacterium]|jgi:type I restriction enzyme S subunit
MELPKGYKLTDVGLVPKDWEVKKLSDFVSLRRGHDLTESERTLGNIPVMSAAGQYGFHNIAIAKGPGVVVGRSGASFGQVHFCESDYWPHNTALYVTDFHNNCPRFVYYRLKNINFSRYNTGGAQPSLNRNFISSILIQLPEFDEQQAIAGALSDIDTLTTTLDQLITKKRNIKQGAIQQLLTAQTRLAGFTDKWDKRRLGEIGNTYIGLSGKSKRDFEDGNLPYITFLNVMNNKAININMFGLVRIKPNERQNRVLKNDILFNTSSETPEEIGMCSVLLSDIEELYLNSFCFGFRLTKNSNAHPLFLVYYLRSSFGRQLFYSLGQGATRYNLSKRNFNNIEIPFPAFAEQEAIARTLNDMEAEIEKIEQQRDKYKAIKQGMMQELLTGKTRLI